MQSLPQIAARLTSIGYLWSSPLGTLCTTSAEQLGRAAGCAALAGGSLLKLVASVLVGCRAPELHCIALHTFKFLGANMTHGTGCWMSFQPIPSACTSGCGTLLSMHSIAASSGALHAI